MCMLTEHCELVGVWVRASFACFCATLLSCCAFVHFKKWGEHGCVLLVFLAVFIPNCDVTSSLEGG